jgi:hypothetical protein
LSLFFLLYLFFLFFFFFPASVPPLPNLLPPNRGEAAQPPRGPKPESPAETGKKEKEKEKDGRLTRKGGLFFPIFPLMLEFSI